MILDRVRVLFNAVGGSRLIKTASTIANEFSYMTEVFQSASSAAMAGVAGVDTTLKEQQTAWARAGRRARFMTRALKSTGWQTRLTQDQVRNLTRTLSHLDLETALAANQMHNLRKAFLYAGFGAWITGAVFRHFGSQINQMVESTVENYADWEWHLTRTQTLLQANTEDMARLSDALKTWATEGIYSLRDITQLVEQLALAGFDLNEIMQATPAILQMATMEGMNLTEAATIAAAAMRAYRYEAEDMAAISNAMALASARSAVEVHDLGESLKYSGAVAGLLGISIREVNAVLGVAGQRFIRGGKAGRYLSQAFQKLIMHGYTFRKGLIPAIEQLRKDLAGMNEEQRIAVLKQMVGLRAARLLAAVIGAQHDELLAFMKLQDQAIVVTALQAKYNKDAKETFEEMVAAYRSAKDPMKLLREEYGLSKLEAEAFMGIMEQGNEVIQDTIRRWDELLTAQKVAHNQLTTLTASLKRLNETWNIFHMTMLEPTVPIIKVVNEIIRNLVNVFRQLPVSIRFIIAMITILTGIFLANAGAILYLVGAVSLLVSSLVQLRSASLLTGTSMAGLSAIFEAAGFSAARFFTILRFGVFRLLPIIGLITLLIELLYFLQQRFHIFDPLLKALGLLKEEAKETSKAVTAISYGYSPGGLVDVIKYTKELKGLIPTIETMPIPEVPTVQTVQPIQQIQQVAQPLQPIQLEPLPQEQTVQPQVVKQETYIQPNIEVNINGAEIVDLESLHVFRRVVKSAVEEAIDEVAMELTP